MIKATSQNTTDFIVIKSIIGCLQLNSKNLLLKVNSSSASSGTWATVDRSLLIFQVNKFGCNQMLGLHHLTAALSTLVLWHALLIAPTTLALQSTSSLFRLSYGTVDTCLSKSRFWVIMAVRIAAVVFKLNWIGISYMETLLIT